MLKVILLGIIGIAAGVIAAAGVGALLTSIGVLTRLAARSGTENRVRHYENCVMLGLIFGTVVALYSPNMRLVASGGMLHSILLGCIGFFMGCFVGCLAMSLSEALDVSSIFFRRLNIKHYLWMIVLAAALGKLVGNFIYFFK